MISVRDAQAHILERVTAQAQPELLPLSAALCRVLAQDVRAEMDVPPTDNSAVDGYAVASADMTGAPMPAGADTVYPQEVVERRDSAVVVGGMAPGANTRRRGEDVQAGAVVLQAGGVLRPQEIGVAASLGLAQLLVRRKPRVAILSTGDEVAEPGTARKPGQIFDSNRFSLRGLVEDAGATVVDDGIVPDRFDELHARLQRAAEHADVVLTSGGLPGNPVASMLTFHLFVRPALWKLAGRRELFGQPFRATALEPMGKKSGRREFKRGILAYAHDRWEVRTTGPQGSGILTSMTAANCFIILEEEWGDIGAGESVWVEPFQPL